MKKTEPPKLRPGQTIVRDGKTVFQGPWISNPSNATPEVTPVSATAPKLQSQLQRNLNMDTFVEKILATPITVTLSEALGSSPLTTKKIQEYLRFTRPDQFSKKTPSTVAVNAVRLGHPQDARLILVTISFENGHQVDAVIDSGSEIDIMNRTTWVQSRIPIDRTLKKVMRDAGQHENVLEGRCANVNLMIGNLKTNTDVWVADNVPFELLLGRPWIRRNYINMEERISGTWLSRRNPSENKIWEVCVLPSRHAEHIHEDPSYFFGQTQHPTGLMETPTPEASDDEQYQNLNFL
jgi:hypothetical protein